MRDMFLIYSRGDDEPLPADEDMATRLAHRAVMDDARARGIFQGAEPLAPAATATTVRHQQGGVLITDGPFAETKEQLAGYYILECRDMDEALERRQGPSCPSGMGQDRRARTAKFGTAVPCRVATPGKGREASGARPQPETARERTRMYVTEPDPARTKRSAAYRPAPLLWAARIPTNCRGGAGSIEVRPLLGMQAAAPINAATSD
ncbi:MAG: YciI family protein [Terriglobales bacterium]